MKKGSQPPASSIESEGPSLPNPTIRRENISEGLRSRLLSASHLEGLNPAEAAFVFATLYREGLGPILWLTSGNQGAEDVARNLRFFLPEDLRQQVLVLPGSEADPYRGLSPHPSITARRAEVLWNLSQGFTGIVATPVSSLMAKVLSPHDFASRGIRLEVGSEVSRDGLISKLRATGYFREDPVGEVGEFSFRGGIVDFFSPSRKNPVRIEFFGDEVESIREFDPASQRSVGLIEGCELAPMREICVSREEIETWHCDAPDYWNQLKFASALEQYMQFTENGELFNGFEYLFPLVIDADFSIFDYLSAGPDCFSVVVTEPDDVFSECDRLWERSEVSYEDVQLEGALALSPDRLLLSPKWIRTQLKKQRVFEVEEFAQDRAKVESLDFRPGRKYEGRVRELLADLNKWSEAGERAVFVMSSSGMADRLAEILREYDVFASVHPEGFEQALERSIGITIGSLSTGFHAAEFGFHLVTQEEVFGERRAPGPAAKPVKKEAVDAFLSDFRDLHEGDYVVHIDHGIGVFRGLQSIGVGERSTDFVALEYREGSKLYVPVDRLDLLQKFSSGGLATPQIDRLGGTSWAKTKRRIKKSMRKLAEDLLKLYARREVVRGHAFAPDDDLMREFENAFEFEETPDQLAAIEACKKDMEAERPMDRLVCGDVGYGKTEVAMRAAFKAVNDGKQVAVLAPTTVLAFQHLNTFSERMKAFPVKVEMVSRFLSRQEQKEVLNRVRLGLVDVLIGTHRILSKDVSFSDLGLVVVDEEQRFGVAQKERLKAFREKVDVLTLSATPIPRTLNMSMVGIRDLSIIETPPKDRLAIQTLVVKFSRNVIRSAIDLELKRKGQVFFVHNSIETIHSVAKMVRETSRDARVVVAHGQMKEDLLEAVMLGFLRYEYDVLVSTTIIENGLDIPRSNTLLVNRADRFGLSQLYQLRGRVGRSNRRAYAYLMISSEELLSTDARKRLAAIREFSELGSGFRLAALDLEIRGAGNLLGGEQSGHIASVGFELYVKLLEQAIRELKGKVAEDEVRTSIDLRFDIEIPQHYIDDAGMRLRVYKQISEASDDESLSRLREEVADQYGHYPRAVGNLFEYARLRIGAQRLKVQSIERRGSSAVLKFRPETPVSAEGVVELVGAREGLSFVPDGSLVIQLSSLQPASTFEEINAVLTELLEEHSLCA